MTEKTEKLTWFKSSHSGGNGDCVEVAFTADGGTAVRDTKNRDGGTLHYTGTEWAAFVAGVRGGEFDLPTKKKQQQQ